MRYPGIKVAAPKKRPSSIPSLSQARHAQTGVPGLPLPAVVEAGLGDAAGELALLDREVDHVAGLVLGAVAGLLPGDAVARVGLGQ